MNYEVIGLLSLDKLPGVVESKRANLCDTVREARAYTVTFVWVDFNCQLEGQWVCVKSSVGFLLNVTMAGLLIP